MQDPNLNRKKKGSSNQENEKSESSKDLVAKGLIALWDEVSRLIARAIQEDNFERWFEGVKIHELKEGIVTLAVPNSIYTLWIDSNYKADVLASFAAITGEQLRLEFFVLPEKENATNKSSTSDQETLFTQQKQTSQIDDEEEEEKESKPQVRAVAPKLTEKVLEKAGIQLQYEFKGFVVGENNRHAYAAAKAVSEAPGRSYNPLFLHSDAGLGKTHLLHSIGLAVLQRNPRSRVVYQTSEQWVNEFIEAIEHRSLATFRSRYRNIDLLLLDDVQFFAGKDRTRSEFFHTFNTLFDGHKQIVISSDRPASEIQDLEPRLRSRFDCGLVTELVAPNRETRMAILKSELADKNTVLDQEVLDFIVDHVTSDIRTLKGALMRVCSYMSLHQVSLSKAELEHHLRDVIVKSSDQVDIDAIQRAVVNYFDLRMSDMTSKNRRAAIAYPRQLAMLLARELTDYTLKDIGDAFGGRDHGTVIHAVKKLEGRAGKDRDTLEQHIAAVKGLLKQA